MKSIKRKLVALIIFLVIVIRAMACTDEKRDDYYVPIKRDVECVLPALNDKGKGNHGHHW